MYKELVIYVVVMSIIIGVVGYLTWEVDEGEFWATYGMTLVSPRGTILC